MTLALREADAKPYGNVTYADPGYQPDKKKRYPLDSEDHCRAAWSYINQQDNAAKYKPVQLAAIKRRIKAAAKRYGIEIADESDRADAADSELRRVLPSTQTRAFDFELRSVGGDGRTLEGYVAVFGATARIADRGGDFDEEIHRGAFDRSLRRALPVMQFDHGHDPRTGSVPIGVYDVFEPDQRGYFVRGRLLDNPVVEPVRQAIAAKAIRGMSWRMMVAPESGDRWTRRTGQVDKRDVLDADVPEAGPVVFPAYDATTVSVRSLLAGFSPEERAALVRELAAELRLAVDLSDLTGQSTARSDDGGELGTEPGKGDAPPAPQLTRQRLDEGALRARGILK